ncbi:unnamed protein product, partial [Mesorhabditis belari]|uniref:Uncharacterized protein n=1 Tax=Mesorhabditis belari TaxID=2138241 RepID=A0AAF3EED7_9BILA
MLQVIVVGFFVQKVSSLLPVSLLENYDKRVAPYDLQNETLVVNISLPLFNLMLVHGQEQLATLIFETRLEWYDDRLKYNPADFNDRHELYLPKDEIWIAHYSLLYAVESKLLTNKRGDTALVAPNGRVVIREMYYAKVGCYARIQRFPFDTQYCAVVLGDTITNTSTVVFSGKLFPKAEVYGNGEFYMQNFSVLSVKPGQKNLPSKIFFYATFERDSFYFVFVIVIPAILITSFTIAGALLPAPGEQAADPINIGLASLLALSITMTIIANDIPKTSVVPLIGWFVLVCLGICTFSVLSGLILDRIRMKISFFISLVERIRLFELKQLNLMFLLIITLCNVYRVSALLPTSLLEGYDKRLAPYDINENHLLVVNISMPMMLLMTVHGQEQMVTLLFDFRLDWIDERLRFNSSNFDNRTELYLPASEIWTVPYNLLNGVESKLLANKRGDIIRVRQNGHVVLRETYYSKVQCGTRVDRFPFDIQFCGIIIANLATNRSTLQFVGQLYPGADMGGNEEFWMTNFSALSVKPSKIENENHVYFWITFERDSFYFIFVIVIPAILITTLTITGVLLPAPGEVTADPVNIGLCSLLALSITLTVVADNIPRTATVPLIGWFVLVCLFLVCFSVIAGLIFDQLRARAKNEELLPGVFDSMIRMYQVKLHREKSPISPRRVISVDIPIELTMAFIT